MFGPVVHVVRYRRHELDAMIGKANALGYGLTFGIHSRVDETIARVTGQIRAGNMYVNRNIIGAVVGVQPFGGRGLSGTGPKAGGPLYLRRLLAGRPAVSGLPHGAVPEAFRQFLVCVQGDVSESDVAAFDASATATPYGARLEFAGPLGEQNAYCMVPRGAVLCVAPTWARALPQIAAALATANRAVVSCEDDLSALDRLPNSLRRHIVTWQRGWVAVLRRGFVRWRCGGLAAAERAACRTQRRHCAGLRRFPRARHTLLSA